VNTFTLEVDKMPVIPRSFTVLRQDPLNALRVVPKFAFSFRLKVNLIADYFLLRLGGLSSAGLGSHFTDGASFNHFGNCLSSKLAGINAAPSSGVLADICFI
jgi:hypothetical protein